MLNTDLSFMFAYLRPLGFQLSVIKVDLIENKIEVYFHLGFGISWKVNTLDRILNLFFSFDVLRKMTEAENFRIYKSITIYRRRFTDVKGSQ